MIKNFSVLIMVACFACNPSEKTVSIDWVLIEGGSFLQGKNQFIISPKGDTITGFTSPSRLVTLDNFYLSKYEITVAQFKEFCKQTHRSMPDPPLTSAYGEPFPRVWQDNLPMLATWDEAQAFANWAGGRLPTEAEWEFAAKGGVKSQGFQYSGSDDAREVGWVRENSDSSMHPVGLLKANELGLHDMTGNIGEWVADWYNPAFDYMSSDHNPQGPVEGVDSMKISKGVSWYYESTDERSHEPLMYGIHMPEVRYQSPINTRNDGFGFRVAKNY